MILICYDGSADAQAAIARAAQLMPGAETTVLTIWEPYIETMTRSGAMGIGMAMTATYVDNEKIDAANQKAALEIATEGAQRAEAAGLLPEPRVAGRHGAVADAILTMAGEVDADVVAMGTRGLAGVRSLMLGSVSHDVVHHSDRAVLVVPSPALAADRRSSRGRNSGADDT